MESKLSTTGNPRDWGTNTLGELLYADTAKVRVPESDWVGLVRCVAAGDSCALQVLYERVHRVVYTLSFRITGSRETAEEVTLDVFHEVWRRASAYDDAGGSVVGWIMNLTRSRAIDRLRFDQRRKRAHDGSDDPRPTGESVQPCDDMDRDDLGRLLRDALSVLTAAERQAIEIAYFSELTYAETAARLDQPVGTIKTRIRSGLEKLRQALAERARDL